jgi:hypothetical protein
MGGSNTDEDRTETHSKNEGKGRCDGDDKTKNHYGHVTIALLQGT